MDRHVCNVLISSKLQYVAFPRVEIVDTPAGARRALTFTRPSFQTAQVVCHAEWSSNLVTSNIFGAEKPVATESGIDTVRFIDPSHPSVRLSGSTGCASPWSREGVISNRQSVVSNG